MDGIQIRTIRRQMGLTQTDMAGLLACQPTTLSRWERGVCRPHHLYEKKLHKLMEKLNDGKLPEGEKLGETTTLQGSATPLDKAV